MNICSHYEVYHMVSTFSHLPIYSSSTCTQVVNVGATDRGGITVRKGNTVKIEKRYVLFLAGLHSTGTMKGSSGKNIDKIG